MNTKDLCFVAIFTEALKLHAVDPMKPASEQVGRRSGDTYTLGSSCT